MEAFCRGHRVDRAGRAEMLDCAKFCRYFTVVYLATMHTPRGRVVLMADDVYTQEFSDFIRNPPSELKGKVLFSRCSTPEELHRIG